MPPPGPLDQRVGPGERDRAVQGRPRAVHDRRSRAADRAVAGRTIPHDRYRAPMSIVRPSFRSVSLFRGTEGESRERALGAAGETSPSESSATAPRESSVPDSRRDRSRAKCRRPSPSRYASVRSRRFVGTGCRCRTTGLTRPPSSCSARTRRRGDTASPATSRDTTRRTRPVGRAGAFERTRPRLGTTRDRYESAACRLGRLDTAR